MGIYGYFTTYDLWWDDIPEDLYEENNLWTAPYNLSAYENTWLSTINGSAVQGDQDWYEISVGSGLLQLEVKVTFNHSEGDIDLDLRDSNGNYVDNSWSYTDNESLNTLVPSSGTYLLTIFGDNNRNRYDLWWYTSIPPPDDNYEENDDYSTAYNLSSYEGTWLDSINDTGMQWDQDWYEISVDPDELYITVEIVFNQLEGNIDAALCNGSGHALVYGTTFSDNESLSYIAHSAGRYYIAIGGENAGNNYTLQWYTSIPPLDDNYEDNDDLGSAYDLSANEATWLSMINGSGVKLDEDWYRVYVNPGELRLRVELIFNHSDGNINMILSNGTEGSDGWLDMSFTGSDNESINYVVPSSGFYYLRIIGDNTGSNYDLWWEDSVYSTDDSYEENDIWQDSYDLTSYEDIWLRSINGEGVQKDDDWYKVQVDSGELLLKVILQFNNSDGDIDLDIYKYDGTLTLIAKSHTGNDVESISYEVSTNGTYYIRIWGANAGNTYKLWWDDTIPTDDDGIPGFEFSALLMILGISVAVLLISKKELFNSKQ